MAVEIASERLAKLPRETMRARVGGAVMILGGASCLALGATLPGVTFLLIGILTLTVLPVLVSKVSQPRLERARKLNAAVLDRGEPLP